MVGAGALMFLLGLAGLWLGRNRHVIAPRWFLWLLFAAIALPYLANSTGWMLTEMGRQPWIVNGLMRIEQAVSPTVGVTELLITLIGFTVVYGVLAVADVYLLQKFARVQVGEKPGSEDLEQTAQAPAGKPDHAYLAGR